mmetsp:Transcript_23397/g.54347  ORF Transcript_23397/g.54347 Transcript_23397/m.54347 type:complete len:116 (+) Transcript_23397:336-683(+)
MPLDDHGRNAAMPRKRMDANIKSCRAHLMLMRRMPMQTGCSCLHFLGDDDDAGTYRQKDVKTAGCAATIRHLETFPRKGAGPTISLRKTKIDRPDGLIHPPCAIFQKNDKTCTMD